MQILVLNGWRRERDSNPRYPFEYSGFQVLCIRDSAQQSQSLTVALPHQTARYVTPFGSYRTLYGTPLRLKDEGRGIQN